MHSWWTKVSYSVSFYILRLTNTTGYWTQICPGPHYSRPKCDCTQECAYWNCLLLGFLGKLFFSISSQGGRISFSASRVFWPSLSGNLMLKSKIMSPLFSGNLDSGNPSPTMRFFIPGLTTSLEVTVIVRPSSVGALTVHPHNAWRERESE